jgi:parallel beta-helix repeat protein
MPGIPAAFMSYAHFNDEHDDGLVSEFRRRLAAEVRVQTGEDFVIFQDRNDIAWGQNWRERIDEALDAATLLVVIMTPSLFRSPACRAEINRFLAREHELGRQDLILPVYYVSAPELDDPVRRNADELAEVLASRQFADWRELRFEPFTSPLVRKAIAHLASRMRDTFWRSSSMHTSRAAKTRQTRQALASPAGSAEQVGGAGRVPAKTEPSSTHVVDAYHRGNFATVSSAIKAAKPGDRILVRPGLYEDSMVVDKPLEILGDGHVSEIEIRARDGNVLAFRATIGRVANLTLRQAGGKGGWYCVDITQGRLDLEGCDISSQSLACVAIRNGADPRLRANKIHDGKECGIYVYEGGLGTVEDNDITGNRLPGVEIRTSANPALRRNQIHDNKQSGVYVYEDGQGMLEDNDIVHNSRAGVEVKTGGSPTIRGNRINLNGFQAVWIYQGGSGVVEDNDLTGNAKASWLIADDCEENVTRARNME